MYISSTISKWQRQADPDKDQPGVEIDLLIDRADHVINLCEVKFTRKPLIVDKKFVQNQKVRLAIFETMTKTRKACIPLLISANGVLDNEHFKEVFQHVITLDDMFKSP